MKAPILLWMLVGVLGAHPALAHPPAIENMQISHGGDQFSAAHMKVVVDPHDPERIALAWRALSMGPKAASYHGRRLICHLSISDDGGRHFADHLLNWGTPAGFNGNAPSVDIGRDGTIVAGATVAGDLPQNGPIDTPPPGHAALVQSLDGGRSWSAAQSVISAADRARFVPDPTVPPLAETVPWDGARVMIDHNTGAVIVSSGFPAKPGGQDHSQRFYTISQDGGAHWGEIASFGAKGWPQRWDGDLIAAHGRLAASYLADAVPVAGVHCLCVVFATGDEQGHRLTRHFVAEVKDVDTVVYYPHIAANQERAGRYALALVAHDQAGPSVLTTIDDGAHWTASAPVAAANVTRATRAALAYAPGGLLVLMWHGVHADGSYDLYMAASADGVHFNPPLKVSTAASRVPDDLKADYAVHGDFLTSLAIGGGAAHAAWSDWRSGRTGQVYYARVPLSVLTGSGGKGL